MKNQLAVTGMAAALVLSAACSLDGNKEQTSTEHKEYMLPSGAKIIRDLSPAPNGKYEELRVVGPERDLHQIWRMTSSETDEAWLLSVDMTEEGDSGTVEGSMDLQVTRVDDGVYKTVQTIPGTNVRNELVYDAINQELLSNVESGSWDEVSFNTDYLMEFFEKVVQPRLNPDSALGFWTCVAACAACGAASACCIETLGACCWTVAACGPWLDCVFGS